MKPEFLPPYWSLDHNKERLDNRMAQNRVDREDYVKAVGRESCVRKNIVPKEYRIVPKGSSHDVLLLCVTCHKISNNCDQELRKRLAQECRAPIGAIDKVKATNPLLKKVVSAAKAIKSAKDKIPFDRLAELEAIITEYYNVSLLTSEVLEEALKIGTQSVNKEPHGRKV
ncbi:hypothetical protein QYM36_005583, partial [Artemia franciscana]